MKSKAHDHIEGLTGTAHNGATKFYELEEEEAFLLQPRVKRVVVCGPCVLALHCAHPNHE